MVRASSASVPLRPSPPEDDDEAPLDPAIERIRQRLRRLILVSIATLFVGLAAVLVAVIYKIGPARDKPGLSGPVEANVAGVLPPGGRVVSSALDGSLLALTVEAGGASSIVVVDLSTNRIVRRIALSP